MACCCKGCDRAARIAAFLALARELDVHVFIDHDIVAPVAGCGVCTNVYVANEYGDSGSRKGEALVLYFRRVT